MSVLTWLPRDVREHLTDLDPAGDAEPADTPAVAELMFDEDARRVAVRRSTVVDIGPRRVRRPRWIAPVAAVAVVAVLAGGVALVRLFEQPASVTPAIGQAGGAAAGTGSAISPAAAAKLWAGFPVASNHRPVVLLNGNTDGPRSGFASSDSKQAFVYGQVQLRLPVAAPPKTMDGYPVIQAAAAIDLLKPTLPGSSGTTTELPVTAIELVEHPFLTDRGELQLPAWQVKLGGVSDPVYILALAPSALYSVGKSAPADEATPATVSADGRTLTVHYVSRFESRDPCNPGFTSSLQAVQTPEAVVVAISIKVDQLPAAVATTTSCAAVGVAPPTGPFSPGEPDTRTVTLAQPLGNRVVVDGDGRPYEVTAP